MKEQNRPPSLMGDSLCGAMQLLAGGFCLRQCAYMETSGDRWLWFLGALLFLTAALWSGRQAVFAYRLRKGRPVRRNKKWDAVLFFCSAAVCVALAVCWPLSEGLRWASVLLSLLFLSAAGLQISYGMRRVRRADQSSSI